ncbi:MAG: N-acetylmuramoyl-L-alanine amidase [Defluviitaleaceae bacterium]|nr:N-acetylmuramoyl-L-alanine amidase [Defluviitaleaceae bacterium]
MKITISSGHGKLVRGAKGLIDEVDEARRVTNKVAEILSKAEVSVTAFHENTARTQGDNVNTIVRFHNSQQRDLDVSIHFNSTASGKIEDRAIGVEVLHRAGNHKTQALAGQVARAISAASGLLLRHPQNSGAVARSNLGFLNNTSAAAILIEVCFVVSRVDVGLYQQYFNEICYAIASAISGHELVQQGATPPTAALQNIMPSSWAREAWEWGVANGLTDGTNPHGSATREQMLTALHRFHKLSKIKAD